MYPNTLALARRLSMPVISFDLEHTGAAGEHRCITDFGAILITPAGDISTYASLVRPPEGTQFNPIVCRLTGIFPHTVEESAGWEKALHEFVLPNQGVLWVGFSSRSSDTPIVYKESRRLWSGKAQRQHTLPAHPGRIRHARLGQYSMRRAKPASPFPSRLVGLTGG